MKTSLPSIMRTLLACTVLLIIGCTSSELVDIWSDSSTPPPSLHKILVVSIGRNAAQRRLWEDTFSAELTKHHASATPSYRLFPDAVPDTMQVIQAVQSNDFDGILVTRRLPSEMQAQYVEGYATSGRAVSYGLRRGMFLSYYRDVWHPGYVDSQAVHVRAFDVWTTSDDGRLIWCATSRTPEPSSAQAARPDIAALVMTELTQRGFIGSAR